MHNSREQSVLRIDGDVPLVVFAFLTRVIPALPSCLAFVFDRLRIDNGYDGLGKAACLAWALCASRTTTASKAYCAARWTSPYTAFQGVKSFGHWHYWQPVLFAYQCASITRRKSCVRGRHPLPG